MTGNGSQALSHCWTVAWSRNLIWHDLSSARGREQDGVIVAAPVAEEGIVIQSVQPIDRSQVPHPVVMKAVWGGQAEREAKDPVSPCHVTENVEDRGAEHMRHSGDMATSIFSVLPLRRIAWGVRGAPEAQHWTACWQSATRMCSHMSVGVCEPPQR